MRRTTIFLSLLVMAAMLLAACGAEETSTSVPSTDVPPVTAESTATDEFPSDTDTTPTADRTTTTPGVPVTGEDSLSRLSNLLDLDVWNQKDEQIGEVEDMILDMNNTNISYVIVGTGGFLDLGEREVLVPWNSLQVDLTGSQENAFILQTEQETFENAPDIDLDELMPERGTPANDWDNDIRNYWESGVVPNTPAADATAVPDVTATVAAGTGTDQAPVEGQGQSGPLQGVMLASEVLGSTMTIGGSQGVGEGQGQGVATLAPASGTAMPDATATVGTGIVDQGQDNNVQATIDDVIVDPETGDILYFVIDASLTEGQRWIPVPFGAFQWDAENEAFVLKANVNALQNAPFFEEGQYPDTTTPGWDDEFDTFWQNPDAGAIVTP